ncbi:hypothetical protein vseg_010409 [Gypsophila vaccaria]
MAYNLDYIEEVSNSYSNSDNEEVDNDDDVYDKDENNVLSLGLQKLSIAPKKKLLVFNLNGVLIHRDFKGRKASFPKDRCPDAAYGGQVVYKRPFLDKFLKFCLERFEVGIWSSAQTQNTEGVVDSVLQKFESQFLFVWDQNQCSDYGYKSLENRKKPLFFKELTKLWSSLADRSSRGRQFSESNTLLIDNESYKALLNPPNTGIFLETYNVRDSADNVLDPKNELGMFLEGLAEAEDVPSYVKVHPFGLPAVGPAHPNWGFYSRIRDSSYF